VRRDRLELIGDLQQAVANRELAVEYQPVIDVAAGGVVGVEALVRWHHPQRGRLVPAAFIGMAEEMGLIVDIGAWVLEEAAGQVRSWQLAYPEAASLRLAVNVSPRQLREDDFPDRVHKALRASGLPPRSLTLEITESALLTDAAGVARRLAKLRAAGIRISIDDFGTGFSSLSHLQVLPVDQLKVDRSFIAALDRGGAGSHLVAGIVQLADELELEVVAEGVETARQLDVLKTLGCGLAQGFFFSQPLAPADLEHWVSDRLASRRPARVSADLAAS
jgi:EAL domain-containing protein (putative c-di-GMP-specific phosphodiesterase class I)